VSTAPSPCPSDPRRTAGRLWPGPASANFCRREAIDRLVRFEDSLRRSNQIHERVWPLIFPSLGRLWIHETPAELGLRELRDEHRRAADLLTESLDYLAAARSENELRELDERAWDRIVKETSR
jgi:hypothetical protein